MNRLSELAVSKRSVTLLLAGALFIAGISAWGSLKQELLPDIEFPVITVIAPYPGAGSQDVADQVAVPIERAISGVPRLETVQSTSANSIALVIAQFEYGTDVKEALAAIEEGIADAGLPDGVEPTASALNINASPVIIASIGATSEDGLEAAADIARTEIVPEIAAIEGVSRADVTGGLEQRLLITLDPDKLAASRRVGRPDHRRPDRQQPDVPVRPAVRRRDQDPGLDDRYADLRRTDRGPRRRLLEAGRRHARRSRSIRTPARPPRRPLRPVTPRSRPRRPITIGDLGTVELRRRRDDRLRPDQRQPVAVAVGDQDLGRQHRPRRRGGPGQARRDRRAPPRTC